MGEGNPRRRAVKPADGVLDQPPGGGATISNAGQFPSAGASRTGECRSDGRLAGVAAIAAVLPVRSSRAIARPRRQAKPRAVIGCWPDEVSRPFWFLSGVRPMFLTVSPVCVRRNERKRSAQSVKRMRQRMERLQSWRVRAEVRPPIGRRRNRADTWREARTQVPAR
jgi:hypothetical protein